MNSKTISILSYITIIGWLIAFFSYNGSAEKSPLAKFHLKQGFGLALLGLLNFILEAIIVTIIGPKLAIIFTVTGIIIFVLWIIGLINAINEKEQPVPVVGGMFTNSFNFIK